jgi:hypothetical protein
MINPKVGDIKTKLDFTVKDQNGNVVDISNAVEKKVTILRYRDNSKDVRDCVLLNDGTDGMMRYITTIDDFTTYGIYKVQGFVKFPDGSEFHTSIKSFDVEKNL